MAVRHHVENLVRRGNIFYWRPRIPRSFVRCRTDARLSLSLRASDHRKAQHYARRLNMLLAELKDRPTARMTTKDQLAKLLAAERDSMTAHLEDVAIMSRRAGRPDDITDVVLDLENGYAYRLLERWGLRRDLDFGPDCPGRKMLADFGVPDAHMANIIANFRTHQKALRGRGFEKTIRALMAEFDIPDTVPNRERATMAWFAGRAEALLDTDERYPLADRTRRALTGGSPSVQIETKIVSSSSDEAQPAEANAATQAGLSPNSGSPPEQPEVTAPPASRVVSTPVPSDDLADLAPEKAEQSGERLLPLAAFHEICDEMIRSKGQEWTKATGADARALVTIFIAILEEHGVAHSGQITQFHLGRLRQHLNEIPTRYGQSARMRAMSSVELRAEAQRMVEEARRKRDAPPRIGLSVATIRKHFGNLDHFLKHLHGHGYKVPSWTFDGLRPKKPKLALVRHQQYKPKPDDMRPILKTPVFTGCEGEFLRHKKGNVVYHDSAYFLPMLLTYLGARRNEFAGLSVDDVLEHPSFGWVIHIRPNSIRRIKNVQSDRLLPLPEELIRLNFLEYRSAIAGLGYEALFPELISSKTDNDPGDRFYKNFTPIMKASLGEQMWKRSFHALRHGLANTLKQNGVPPAIIDDIEGRLSEGETNNRYTLAAEPPLMRDALAKFPVITDHLTPQPIRLLSWIENRQPAPWGRKARSGTRSDRL